MCIRDRIKYGSILDATDNTISHIISGHESTNYDYLQDGDIIVADTAEDKTVGKTIELLNISGRKPRHSSFVRIGSGVIAYCPITTIC